jgi:hypothetical protein
VFFLQPGKQGVAGLGLRLRRGPQALGFGAQVVELTGP